MFFKAIHHNLALSFVCHSQSHTIMKLPIITHFTCLEIIEISFYWTFFFIFINTWAYQLLPFLQYHWNVNLTCSCHTNDTGVRLLQLFHIASPIRQQAWRGKPSSAVFCVRDKPHRLPRNKKSLDIPVIFELKHRSSRWVLSAHDPWCLMILTLSLV